MHVLSHERHMYWRLPTETPAVSCVLDPIEAIGAMTLDEVGAALGVSRERARQIEADALHHLRRAARLAGMSDDDLAQGLAALCECESH